MDIIRGVEVLNLQTYVLLETVGNNLAVFTAQSTKFYYIDSDEISELLYRKLISLPRAVNVPLTSSHVQITMSTG